MSTAAVIPSTFITRGSQIIKYIAGPGTGKTWQLLEYLQKERDDHGITIHDVQFLSFSKAQVKDVKPDIIRIFSITNVDTVKNHVRTIHGAALSSLYESGDLTKSSNKGWKVIFEGKNSRYYMDFCIEQGLSYNRNIGKIFADEAAPQYRGNIPDGNALFAINNFLSAKMWDYSFWATGIDTLGMRVDKRSIDITLLTLWETYKKSHRLLEHEDYCKLALEKRPPLPGRVLFIDEFQDVSPSHNALYEMWRDQGTFERIYIAGDPNQSIYGFRGCDPSYLINTPGIGAGAAGGNIPQSHRCPSEIIRFADMVLCGQSNMTPCRDGGSVEWFGPYNAISGDEIDAVLQYVLVLQRQYGKVMILCRFQSQIKKWHDAFNQQGVPHLAISGKYHTWDKVKSDITKQKQSIGDILFALHGFDRYQNGEKTSFISLDEARTIIRLIDIDDETRSGILSTLNHHNPKKSVMISTLIQHLSMWVMDMGVHSLINNLIFTQSNTQSIRALLQAAIENNHILHPTSILLDTLHSSKGLEAPAVVIDCSFIKDRAQDVIFEPCEERRIGYVGVTRTSEHVVMIEPFKGVWNPVFEDAKERWHESS